MDKTAAGCGSPSPEGVIVQTDALPNIVLHYAAFGAMSVRVQSWVVWRWSDVLGYGAFSLVTGFRDWPARL